MMLARFLPEQVKAPLRVWLRRFSDRERWLRREYTAIKTKWRREMLVAIARFHHISRPMHGYYMEFGCCGARSARDAWDSFRHLFDWHFLFFDSFKGFPKLGEIDQQEGWQEGTAAMEEGLFVSTCLRHGIPRERFTTIKGFYDKTLTAETARRFPKKAAVIYVDCDLYESAVSVLSFSRHFLQPGTVIVFDDWNCYRADPNRGERRAWREFSERHPEIRFEEFWSNGEQKTFVCITSS